MKNVVALREKKESNNLKKEKIKLFVGTRRALSFWCNKTKQKHTNKIMSNVVGGSISMRPAGITLIALVITIIVLLILAGVALNMVIGENGIFGKANKAKEDTNYNTALEEINLIILEAQTEALSEGRTPELTDVIEELKKDERYEYIINKEGIATLSSEGNYSTVEAFKADPVKKIYVIHKGYEFEIGEDLKVKTTGNKTEEKVQIIPKIGDYVLESEANAKVEVEFEVKIIDKNLEGKSITIESKTTNLGNVTIDNTNMKATIEKNGANPVNGKYTFEIKVGTETFTKEVQINRFITAQNPEIEITDVTYCSFKVNVKNHPTTGGIKYKYYITKKSDSAEYYTSSDYETTTNKVIDELVYDTEYNVKVEVYVGSTKAGTSTTSTQKTNNVTWSLVNIQDGVRVEFTNGNRNITLEHDHNAEKYIYIEDNKLNNLFANDNGNCTICFWRKKNTGGSWLTFGEIRDDMSVSGCHDTHFVGGGKTGVGGGQGYATCQVKLNLDWDDNEWHFCAVSFVGGNKVIAYGDGMKAEGSGYYNSTAYKLMIGGSHVVDGQDGISPNGTASDIRIYNRALTETEINQIKEEGRTYLNIE